MAKRQIITYLYGKGDGLEKSKGPEGEGWGRKKGDKGLFHFHGSSSLLTDSEAGISGVLILTIAYVDGSAKTLVIMSQKGNLESLICPQNTGYPKIVPSELVHQLFN